MFKKILSWLGKDYNAVGVMIMVIIITLFIISFAFPHIGGSYGVTQIPR